MMDKEVNRRKSGARKGFRVQIPTSALSVEFMKKKYPEPAVGALILNDKKQILLTKSHKWKNCFTIPGGHIELHERIEDALKREVREEVGLEVKPIKFLLMQEAIYSKEFYKPKHFIFLDYLCKAESNDVKVDGDEIQEFLWIDPEKALEINVDTFTKRTISKYLETINK